MHHGKYDPTFSAALWKLRQNQKEKKKKKETKDDVIVLIPAIHIHLTSTKSCCANRCGMFLSIGFAALGVVGAVYSLSVAALGLSNGPTCLWRNLLNPIPEWGTPFNNTGGSYLGEKDQWAWCIEPKNVVEFNVGLFSTLLVAACVELVFCLIQMVNGLFGCICGTCGGKEVRAENGNRRI
ncbi:Transmembrane 4 L6 family member 1 [Liparis tanakae]|uniref:Transmembrane 4 L6 family member 1 n=1 Tax=Liparis tanakae TaxID=230148 RepID=A0A4Z2ECJ0_9TELE|nr:Transmembrane 4 L6 family member 1 [Liparis tanakae]